MNVAAAVRRLPHVSIRSKARWLYIALSQPQRAEATLTRHGSTTRKVSPPIEQAMDCTTKLPRTIQQESTASSAMGDATVIDLTDASERVQ
jgi:hypothetical protein